jgi:hypothetical protein
VLLKSSSIKIILPILISLVSSQKFNKILKLISSFV